MIRINPKNFQSIFTSHQTPTLIFYALFLFVATSTLTYYLLGQQSNSIHLPQNPSTAASFSQPPTIPPDLDQLKQINIALFGHGDAGHEGGGLTDAILIAHFDRENNHFALISLPRDLWIPYPDGSNNKLNAAFVKNPDTATIAKQSLQTITGLPIHYFIAVDFFGIQAIVDELKGVTINLPENFSDPWYPIRGRELDLCGMSPEEIDEVHQKYSGFELEKQFDCRYEHINLSAGQQQLDGSLALKLARSRHGSSDFARSQRQQLILLAIKDKLLSLGALTNAPDIYTQLAHTFSSDLSLEAIGPIAATLTNFPEFTSSQINLSSENILTESTGPAGQYILSPKSDWSSIHSYLNDQMSQ